jgi:hypothetical protein
MQRRPSIIVLCTFRSSGRDLTAPSTTKKRHSTSTSSSSYGHCTHAEHHASSMPQTLRMSFVLDIPFDATPSFQLLLGGKPSEGGPAWKVHFLSRGGGCPRCAGVRYGPRGLRGRWCSTWVETDGLASHKYLPTNVADTDTEHNTEVRSSDPEGDSDV